VTTGVALWCVRAGGVTPSRRILLVNFVERQSFCSWRTRHATVPSRTTVGGKGVCPSRSCPFAAPRRHLCFAGLA